MTTRTFQIVTAAALTALSACTATPPAGQAANPMEIRILASFAGTPFACGQTYQLGNPPVPATPSDLRFYVSDVTLMGADGTSVPFALASDGRWQAQGVALLDFEDGTGPCAAGGSPGTNTTLRGTAPAGTYTGLRFTLGVPDALNHQDATIAAAPFNVTAMFWNWQNGYKFLKADFSVPGAMKHGGGVAHGAGHGGGGGFALHLGSTQCAASAPTQPGPDCKNPNRPVITLTGFDPSRDNVVVDLAPVLAKVDLRHNTPGTPPGCMSFPGDPECKSVLPPLGVGYEGVPAQSQRAFTVRAKAATAAR